MKHPLRFVAHATGITATAVMIAGALLAVVAYLYGWLGYAPYLVWSPALGVVTLLYALWLWLDPRREPNPQLRKQQATVVALFVPAPFGIWVAAAIVFAAILTSGFTHIPF